jgi:multiple sugar transport system substrate-binding protein
MFSDVALLAKAGKAHFIEEQGSQYEGLTVWFNSLVDSAGGGILTKDDKIIVGPSTRVAATIMHELATSAAADPSLNVTMEAQSETAFEHNTAAFQINYPFVWAAAHKDTPSIGKEMGYALFPRVNPAIAPRVSIGGYNLGVSSFSKHPQLAFDAVRCMIQPQFQRRDAIKGGLAPVQASIYSEPAFIKAYPFAAMIKAQLERYGIRPQTPVYADVTLAIQKALSPTAAIQPRSVVSTLRNEIKQALSSKALL